MPQYRYVGNVADTVYQGDKAVPVGPGDYIELSDEQFNADENTNMRDTDLLLEVTGSAKASHNRLKAVDKEGGD